LAKKVGGGVVALLSYDKRELSIIRWGVGSTAQSSESVVNGPWAALGSSSFSPFSPSSNSFDLFSSPHYSLFSFHLLFSIFI